MAINSKSLMLGDWVKYTNPAYIQVANITKKKIGYHIKPDEPRMHYVRTCEIEPIPLTHEILEKNGWIYNNEVEKFFPQTWVGGGLMLHGALYMVQFTWIGRLIRWQCL